MKRRKQQSSARSEAQPPLGCTSASLGVAGTAGRRIALAAILVAIVVAAYLPALRGRFVWDDDDYVSENQTLRSADGLRAIWLEPAATPQYYPLVHTTFWLEYRLWGLAPAGYHVTNLVLHLLAAVLLWRVLCFLSLPGAPLVALIFAVHPVHVESVAWITERKNVLSAVCFLAAMLAYLRFALGTGQPKRWRLYGAACAFFLLALLSKSVTATLPAALLILMAWKRGRGGLRDLPPLLPFFAAGMAMGLATAWLEKVAVGAQGRDWQLTLLDRCLVAGRALCFYAGKLVWPRPLIFIYPRWQVDASDAGQYLYPVGALATVVSLWLMRRQLGRGPLVAVSLFIVTLIPALGFFDIFPMRYSFVADHYQYLASIALIALGVGAGIRLTSRWAPANGRVARGLGVVLAAVLAILTWRQCHAYADLETLWRDTIAKDPDSFMGHDSLGALLGRRERLGEAEWHYREAIRANPTFASARFNLGALLANQGRYAEAMPHMREAVRLDPKSTAAVMNLAEALLDTGESQEAIAVLRHAAATWPDLPAFRQRLESIVGGTGAPPAGHNGN